MLSPEVLHAVISGRETRFRHGANIAWFWLTRRGEGVAGPKYHWNPAMTHSKRRTTTDRLPVSVDEDIECLDESRRQDMPIGVLLHDVARLRRQMFDAETKPLGLTRSQCWVLVHLSRHRGRMMQSEIAAALDVGKVSLGGLIDRLEAGGLVRRESAPEDRRVKYVRLTAKGRRAVDSTNIIRPLVDEHMMRGLSRGAREELVAALTHMRTKLLDVRRNRGSASEQRRKQGG